MAGSFIFKPGAMSLIGIKPRIESWWLMSALAVRADKAKNKKERFASAATILRSFPHKRESSPGSPLSRGRADANYSAAILTSGAARIPLSGLNRTRH